MDDIITSIYTNASKHGDDVSKIIKLDENAVAAIIADGVSTCTSGRVASSFLVHYTEKYLKRNFKEELGAEELEDMACSAIEYGAQELVRFNNTINKASWLLHDFYRKSNDVLSNYQNDLNNIVRELKRSLELLNEKSSEKIAEARAHAKVREVLEDKRASSMLLSFFGFTERRPIEKFSPVENLKLDNEIKELKKKIEKLEEDGTNLERKISDVHHYSNNVAAISYKRDILPKYLLDDNLYMNILKEVDIVSSTLLSIIKETLNENEKQKDVYQKIQSELLSAIKKNEKLLFKTNFCLAILIKRSKRGKKEYRLNTFVLGDPEVRVISIKNKDNKEVYFKNSSAGLTSFISNDAESGISGSIDFQSLSVKQDDFIILASDGANIRYNKSSTFPYTYFINILSNCDKSEKSDISKLWYQQLEKESAVSDDFSLIALKIK